MTEIIAYIKTTPQPKGSVSGFPVKNKQTGKLRAVVTHSAKSKEFEKKIRTAIEDAPYISGPVIVTLWFYIARPTSVTRDLPSVKPDIDKLARAVLDALKGHWEDDSRVVDLLVYKRYATESCPEGVFIHVVPSKFTS